MFIKIHKAYRDVVAICDSNLIGKKFEDGSRQLEVKEKFFKGEEKTEKEVIKLIERLSESDATFNIVGKSSCEAAIKAGIVSKEEIKTIKKIPFALVLL